MHCRVYVETDPASKKSHAQPRATAGPVPTNPNWRGDGWPTFLGHPCAVCLSWPFASGAAPSCKKDEKQRQPAVWNQGTRHNTAHNKNNSKQRGMQTRVDTDMEWGNRLPDNKCMLDSHNSNQITYQSITKVLPSVRLNKIIFLTEQPNKNTKHTEKQQENNCQNTTNATHKEQYYCFWITRWNFFFSQHQFKYSTIHKNSLKAKMWPALTKW